ncbi:MAG: tRNA (adenosine(37)-N6)-threonylcarbamoyltransferase complex ATPase subunit type 1 TsaE [Bryobacteraceae bacterium]|nr:MAG: tRNA (adenosine(37)-N6)-threonylcarbamoyltransferase complex ATPase subunit type 1 TsaE [Bryobacteraceae bacterium]
MRTRTFITRSEEETIALAAELARQWPVPCCVVLSGELGAGKTTFAKGVAEGLGAAPADDISSPTFALIHEHGGGRLYHVDLYRLDTEAEAASLGLDEILARPAVVLLEWAERFPRLLPEERIEIRIEAQPDDSRRIQITELP